MVGIRNRMNKRITRTYNIMMLVLSMNPVTGILIIAAVWVYERFSTKEAKILIDPQVPDGMS